jgi:hypothetical protein
MRAQKMKMVDQSGRLFGKFNVIDFSALAMLLLVALGILLVQSGLYRTSGQQVKGESDIEYTIALRNVKTFQPDLFKKGNQLSITIRNQPRGNVLITDSQVTPKKMVVPSGQSYQVINDPIDTNGFDYIVKLRDHAVITGDGYVTNGIKVKIGLPIEVEGFNYRLPAVIADIREVK